MIFKEGTELSPKELNLVSNLIFDYYSGSSTTEKNTGSAKGYSMQTLASKLANGVSVYDLEVAILKIAELMLENYDYINAPGPEGYYISNKAITEKMLEFFEKKMAHSILGLFYKFLSIEEYSASSDNNSSLLKLEFYIQPGTATPEEIGELLGEISKLYKMIGGSGIEYRLDGVKQPKYILDYE